MEPRRPVGNAGGRARARFGVPVEIRAEFATLEVVDPPREIAWTGTTMRIKAVHVFRFEAMGGGTLARSEMSSPTSRPRRSVALAWRKRWGTGVEHVIADLAGES
jgi:hypothetical protein